MEGVFFAFFFNGYPISLHVGYVGVAKFIFKPEIAKSQEIISRPDQELHITKGPWTEGSIKQLGMILFCLLFRSG